MPTFVECLFNECACNSFEYSRAFHFILTYSIYGILVITKILILLLLFSSFPSSSSSSIDFSLYAYAFDPRLYLYLD